MSRPVVAAAIVDSLEHPTPPAIPLPTGPTGAVDPPHTGPTGAVEPKTANKSAQNHTNSWLFWLAKPFLVAKIEP